MKDVISMTSEDNIRHVIIVYPDSITCAAKNILTRSFDMKIELFSQQELQINITKHTLQPQFEKLNTKDKEEMIKMYSDQFPKMDSSKAISKFYDYQKDDLIRIRERWFDSL